MTIEDIQNLIVKTSEFYELLTETAMRHQFTEESLENVLAVRENLSDLQDSLDCDLGGIAHPVTLAHLHAQARVMREELDSIRAEKPSDERDASLASAEALLASMHYMIEEKQQEIAALMA
ncbi:hypothetical protein [Rathayibacter festucae]|uniref:hypothetical protein n=1 Tax=Rathayibacter festucae TaxID=110937 RepID=UPI002A6AFA55|nr:hypothetical protein [Rathayibacter festucae]MDY0911314.1 hypothetical protein [Rathayibacter festucae]